MDGIGVVPVYHSAHRGGNQRTDDGRQKHHVTRVDWKALVDFDRSNLHNLDWMPSRIPVLDALEAIFEAGEAPDKSKLPLSRETRWYPLDDGRIRFLAPHWGDKYDETTFQLASKAWDHTTCDLCISTVPAMKLFYVTKHDPNIQLCLKCYSNRVVSKLSLVRNLTWRIRQFIDEAAA